MNTSKLNGQYEVLNPWAEVDPNPSRGISPRLKDLTGKKIGLFVNYKLAAQQILTVVEGKLKERFSTADFSYFVFRERGEEVAGTEAQANFEKWLSEVDAVILGVGD